MGENELRYVVLADVIGSSNIDDRDEFREKLKSALKKVNNRFDQHVESDFDIIKGIDEFGGVISSLSNIYEIIELIHAQIYPVMVRFGVSGDDIDVKPSTEIGELDGPAFHRADTLLSEVEEDGLFFYLDTGRPVDFLLSNNVNLLLLNRENWTKRQNEIVRAYEEEDTQSDAAQKLDINQQSVSKALKKTSYRQTKLLRDYLKDVIPILYYE